MSKTALKVNSTAWIKHKERSYLQHSRSILVRCIQSLTLKFCCVCVCVWWWGNKFTLTFRFWNNFGKCGNVLFPKPKHLEFATALTHSCSWQINNRAVCGSSLYLPCRMLQHLPQICISVPVKGLFCQQLRHGKEWQYTVHECSCTIQFILNKFELKKIMATVTLLLRC